MTLETISLIADWITILIGPLTLLVSVAAFLQGRRPRLGLVNAVVHRADRRHLYVELNCYNQTAEPMTVHEARGPRGWDIAPFANNRSAVGGEFPDAPPDDWVGWDAALAGYFLIRPGGASRWRLLLRRQAINGRPATLHVIVTFQTPSGRGTARSPRVRI
jgi:hypothetical protein